MAIFFIGNHNNEYRESMESAIGRASTGGASEMVYFAPDVSVARQLLAGENVEPVRCVFVDIEAAGIDQFVPWMRDQAPLFSAPIFALLSHISDQGFDHAHACGIDDALDKADTGGLTRRVASLSKFDSSARPPISQGCAIIAHPDQRLRRLFGRILRQAGFDTRFAVDGDDLVSAAGSAKPRIIIAALNLPPDGAVSSIVKLRQAASGFEPPCVLVGSEQVLEDHAAEARKLKTVELISEKQPPDSLLFVSNELLRREALRGKADEQRASARVLYGALCSFQAAGNLVPSYGYAYNISNEGMYIKTYDPPEGKDDLWIGLRIVDDMTAVHLRAKLVWTRLPDASKPALVPPGFGLRIDETACPPDDIKLFRAMYRRILETKAQGAVS